MIPDDVRRFVLTSVPSVPHLEALVLFHAHPGVERTASDLAQSLYLPEPKAAEVLDYLCQIRCLAAPSGTDSAYRYAPADDDMRQLLDRLVAAYRLEMIDMTHLIHDATQKNALLFAQAFKLKKER